MLEQSISQGERLVTDAEVLQEILHRYVAIDRRDAVQPAFDAVLGVVDDVLPITRQDAERAKAIVLGSIAFPASPASADRPQSPAAGSGRARRSFAAR